MKSPISGLFRTSGNPDDSGMAAMIWLTSRVLCVHGVTVKNKGINICACVYTVFDTSCHICNITLMLSQWPSCERVVSLNRGSVVLGITLSVSRIDEG